MTLRIVLRAARRSCFANIAVLCLLMAMLLCAAPALAARPHVFSKSFAKSCAAEPCTGEFVKQPIAVAVGEEAGQVYVLDEGEPGQFGRVVAFSADGTKVEGEFDGSGEGPGLHGEGEGTAAGGGGNAGEIPTGRFEEPTGIAVDNSCALRRLREAKVTPAECEAADPSNGDVYVADSGGNHLVIDKYTADGKYVGQITEAGSGFPFQTPPFQFGGVAVDPSGGVWVYRNPRRLDAFTNASTNAFSAETELGAPGYAIPGIAVDAEGNFYGRVGVAFPPRIVKWDHTGKVLDAQLGGEEASGVAVDQGSNVALVDNLTSVSVFNPEGERLERLGQGQLTAGTGLGVDSLSDSFYAADASGKVLLFGPAPSTAPVVEGESFSGIGSDRASLEAEINPSSEELPEEGQSTYHFEYGRCASLDPSSCKESPYEQSTPTGALSPDFKVHPVSAEVTGLSPSTTYHFRVRAENKHGEAGRGAELTFTTEGSGGEVVLPDDRGWELVSPPDKKGALIEPLAPAGVVQAAASGGGISYIANSPTEAEPAGYSNFVQVLSRRSGAAWSSRDLSIPHSAATGSSGGLTENIFFTPELSADVVQPLGQFTALSEDASEATAYLRDLGESCAAHCFTPLVTGKAGVANVPEGTAFGEEGGCESTAEHSAKEVCGPRFLGASEDLSHIVLRSESVALAPGAVPQELFEWVAGALEPVSVLPGPGHEPTEATLGRKNSSTRGAISSDGNRIAWGTSQEHLYLRDMKLKATVQLDQSEGCGGCTSGPGARFQFASSDGSRVLFTDEQRLSKGAGAATGEPDLYECEVVQVGEALTCKLSDLTPAREGESANVQGGLLGASADGSSVYFVAEGMLAEEANAREEKANPGQANLYVRRGGRTEFIATLSSEPVVGGGSGPVPADEADWELLLQRQPTRVSANGRYLELMSQARLSDYDNRDVASGKPAAEVYIYDASTRRLSCASCDPSGGRPVGVEYHKLEPGAGGLVGGPRAIWVDQGLVAANVPGWTAIGAQGAANRYQPRYLSNEGRLFFNSVNALVPQDANATQDVYQYEPPGVGNCSSESPTYSPRSGGCVALISSGGSAQESAFLDASESGDDVFFLTSARLSKLDVDGARDVYDAHACPPGGTPCITFPSTGSPPCDNEASCKASPTPQPSIFEAPASATFVGSGNQSPLPVVSVVRRVAGKAVKCARGKRLRHGKCVRVRAKKKTKRKGRK